MAEVALQKVNKTFPGGVRAVIDLGLTVADSEFVVLELGDAGRALV